MSPRRSIPMTEIDRFKARLEERSDALPDRAEEVIEIPVALLDAAPWNARRYFSDTDLEELRVDIAQNGLIHPIVVRPVGERFEVVVGERRFRAVQRSTAKKIRASVRHLSDLEARRMGLSENLERTDLNRYEETIGWLDLLELNLSAHTEFASFQNGKKSVQDATISVLRRYKHESEQARHNVMPSASQSAATRDQLVVGSPLETTILETFSTDRMTWKSFIENRLPLLHLPADLLGHLRDGRLEYTKALELSKISDDETRSALTFETIQLSLPLTQLRTRVKALLSPASPATPPATLEGRLQQMRVASRAKRALTKPQQKRLERLMSELEALLGVTQP